MGVGGQCHSLAALPLKKIRYSLCRGLGGPQSWSGRVQKISPPPGFNPWTFQPVASHYTNYLALLMPLYFQTTSCDSGWQKVLLPVSFVKDSEGTLLSCCGSFSCLWSCGVTQLFGPLMSSGNNIVKLVLWRRWWRDTVFYWGTMYS